MGNKINIQCSLFIRKSLILRHHQTIRFFDNNQHAIHASRSVLEYCQFVHDGFESTQTLSG